MKGVFACVGMCVGTDMCPCACVCTHVCEGLDHLCATVCPHDCVWVQCVCAYLRAGCVYGVCMCVKVCGHRHVCACWLWLPTGMVCVCSVGARAWEGCVRRCVFAWLRV